MPMVRRRGKRSTVGAGTARFGLSTDASTVAPLFAAAAGSASALAVKAAQSAARSSRVVGVASSRRVSTSSVPCSWRVSPYSRESAGARRARRLAKGRPPRGRFRTLRQLSIRRRQASAGVSAVTLNGWPGVKRGNTMSPWSIVLWAHDMPPSSLTSSPQDES